MSSCCVRTGMALSTVTAQSRNCLHATTPVCPAGVSVSRRTASSRRSGQEVFLRAYKSLDTYCGDSRVSTWIPIVIARNQSMTALERRASQPDYLELTAAVAWADPNGGAAYDRIEATRVYGPKCEQLLSTLTPTEAAVLVLHYGQDFSLASVTQQLRLKNKSGAKAYIVSARRKLGPILERNFDAWVAVVA